MRGRGEEVDPAVAVEVVGDGAAEQVEGGETELGRDVLEAREGRVRGEDLGRDAEGLGNAVGILTDGHRRDVGEPDRLEVNRAGAIGGGVRRQLEEPPHRLARALLLDVDAGATDRQDAALGVVPQRAVLALAAAQPGDAEAEARLDRLVAGHARAELGQHRHRLLQRRDGAHLVGAIELGEADLELRAETGERIGIGAQRIERRACLACRPIADVEVLLGCAPLDLREQREHPVVTVQSGAASRGGCAVAGS